MSTVYQVITPSAPLTNTPREGSSFASELLYGECVERLSEDSLWSYVRNISDTYEGYVHQKHLAPSTTKTTHKVIKLLSLLYAEPDFKTAPSMHLPFHAQITPVGDERNGFTALSNQTWIWKDDIAPIKSYTPDYVDTASQFENVPYLWGGRTNMGLDCSALVQISLNAAGIFCPRDAYLQQDYLGNDIPYDTDSLQRGDLVYFKGHVGMMIDSKNILNATSRTMDVRIESLSKILPYYDNKILAIKRLLD